MIHGEAGSCGLTHLKLTFESRMLLHLYRQDPKPLLDHEYEIVLYIMNHWQT